MYLALMYLIGKEKSIGLLLLRLESKTPTVDPLFAQNWDGMKSAGFKYKGAYHYLEPDDNCTDQAIFFYNTILKIDPEFSFSTDFLALDVEVPSSGSAKDYQKCLSDFLSWLPVTFIYTSQSFFDSICSTEDCCLSTVFYFDCTSLWVVDYQSASIPRLPYCWNMAGACSGALILGLAGLGILLYKRGSALYKSTQHYWHLASGWCNKDYSTTKDSRDDTIKKQSANYFSFLRPAFCFKKSVRNEAISRNLEFN